jgi:hypothetical protein
MAAPDITIAVEPVEAGKAVYLPLAAKAANQDPQFKIVLRLRITNNYTDQVVIVTAIQFSFPRLGGTCQGHAGHRLYTRPGRRHEAL